jgi:hypothetical protein
MNIIYKRPIAEIGYNFIESQYLPKGKNEYHLRDVQNQNRGEFRKLTPEEKTTLINNNNTSDNWDHIHVSSNFNPHLVKHSNFFGLVRIGDLSPVYHEFHNFKMPEGIYNSTIISCDIANHVCIDKVSYLSHYIIEDDVMLANINELATTDKAKFGNGILKDGEKDEKQRMVIEVCNENGGRYIIPYNGMLAGDAYMWSKFRDDKLLLEKFKWLTEKKFDKQRGYYGKIGARTVIKNCDIIKDTWIGTDAYLKGSNKLKNLTINSDAERKTQIGEGCELVNGIIGYGCRIFYGVKAVRFITASHSQLKYGARLINSYLGNNSTISCCEVLNSLIFAAHEQHHNNSFLCASLVMGQSNIAAGVTIGSNHNSRSADGEIIAGRGFWPGLCVSLKHNSKFASFTILAKGDYPSELNIPVPFSLVSHDVANNKIVVMPAYWFMYNMYALTRNAWKYIDRDKRTHKIQLIEFDYLAPDTVNEIFDSLQIFKSLQPNEKGEAEITGWENSNRKILITKIPQSTAAFSKMIKLYACMQMLHIINTNKIQDFDSFKKVLKQKKERSNWMNVGGQLIQTDLIDQLKINIKTGKIKSWDEIHKFYQLQGQKYEMDKLTHAYTTLLEHLDMKSKDFTSAFFYSLLKETIAVKEWMFEEIYNTRAKDYKNTFRKMVYNNEAEMVNVLGKIEDNSFINEQRTNVDALKKNINSISRKWKLKL